jgi:hypothetical protein
MVCSASLAMTSKEAAMALEGHCEERSDAAIQRLNRSAHGFAALCSR